MHTRGARTGSRLGYPNALTLRSRTNHVRVNSASPVGATLTNDSKSAKFAVSRAPHSRPSELEDHDPHSSIYQEGLILPTTRTGISKGCITPRHAQIREGIQNRGWFDSSIPNHLLVLGDCLGWLASAQISLSPERRDIVISHFVRPRQFKRGKCIQGFPRSKANTARSRGRSTYVSNVSGDELSCEARNA